MRILIKKLHSEAKLPDYKTEHSAGADIHACLNAESYTLSAGQIAMIPTGFAMEIPAGYEAQIRPRSGLAKKGLSIPNAPGTIDADYRGEVKVIMINLGNKDFTIRSGDRIAQMIIAPVIHAEFQETDDLSETIRGEGGFGSTGVN